MACGGVARSDAQPEHHQRDGWNLRPGAGTGKLPEGRVTGKGLDSTLHLAGRRIDYDARTDRIRSRKADP